MEGKGKMMGAGINKGRKKMTKTILAVTTIILAFCATSCGETKKEAG